jgi:ABC-type transport system involved in cytochrome c biogenesis permease component
LAEAEASPLERMRFLPVVERELRVAARNPRLYWGRFTAAFIAIVLVAWFWMTFGGAGNSANRAKQIFGTLGTFAFIYCLILGVLVTADSISEEKREGTLGLLFLTNLKGYDVVFGKLFASSLHGFYSLVAILPVLAIPILLGGLTGGDFGRMAIVLLDSLIFSLSMGMLMSAYSKHDRKSQVGAFGLVAFFTLILPGLVAWSERKLRFEQSAYFYGLSPVYAFSHSFDQLYKANTEMFWTSVISIHVLSWIALALAAIIVRRVWQDRPKVGRAFRRQEKMDQFKRGTVAVRNHYREHLLNINPFYWLSARDRMRPLYVLGFLFSVALVWLVLYLYNGNDMLEQESIFLTALFLHTAMKIWLASEAGRRFSEDRKSGALELTLSTPLKVREILEGQFMALLRQFGGTIGIILVLDITGMILSARMRLSSPDSDWILTCVAGMIVFVVDLFAIAALGMWLGLSSKRASRAVGQTIFFVMILPWILLLALITYMSIVRYSGIESFKLMLGAYFLLSVVIDFFFFLRASGNLTSQFREVATTRFDPRPS